MSEKCGAKDQTFCLAGISKNPLNHEEVVEIADLSKQKLQGFMKEFLSELNSDN